MTRVCRTDLYRTCVWLCLCVCFGFGQPGWAKPPLVVILLPGTSLRDWQTADAPRLHQLMADGALALMNTRTARLSSDHARETPESAALTLGAGARASESDAAGFLPESTALSDSDTCAGELYQRRTGYQPLRGQLVCTAWPFVQAANLRLGYQIRIGNLADTLARVDVRMIAGGGPFAALVAAGGTGTVKQAERLALSSNQCFIWDVGSDIADADSVIGSAAGEIARQNGRLIVLSPFAGDRAFAQGRRLTPVLEWGSDVPPGLLLSPSTHQAGLVTNTDFAPTVAAYFGQTRTGFPALPYGFAWEAMAAASPEKKTAEMEAEAVTQAQGMRALPYLAAGLAVWILSGTILAFQQRLPRFWPLVPPVVLLALLFSNSVVSLASWSAVIGALACVPAERLGSRRIVLGLLAVLAGSLLADMVTGGRLMHRGLLGYSAIEGARYYGIGNEAMGVLVGSLMVLAARGWQRAGQRRWLLLVLLGTICLLMGLPNAGAKAGGLVVSLAAFGTLGFCLLGGRWTVRAGLALCAALAAVMACAALGETLQGTGGHSHIGEAVRRIETGGLSQAGDIVFRKAAVESRLAYRSAWAGLLWGGIACLGLLWRTQPRTTQPGQAIRLAGAVAIAACVLFNDAGVLAGAYCLLPLWCDEVCRWDQSRRKEKPRKLQEQFPGQSQRRTY